MSIDFNIPRRIRQHAVAIAALAIVLALSSVAQACPTCGAGMADGTEAGQKMLNGWFWSIVFMMSMPFAIVTSLGGYMYWIVRRARRAAGESPAATPNAAASRNAAAAQETAPRASSRRLHATSAAPSPTGS